MKKVIRLTESDLVRIVKKVVRESEDDSYDINSFKFEKPTKFDVDGVKCSLVNNELYFPKIGEVVKFPDKQLAKSAFFWCKLHAEDGLSEKEIHSKVMSKLREMFK